MWAPINAQMSEGAACSASWLDSKQADVAKQDDQGFPRRPCGILVQVWVDGINVRHRAGATGFPNPNHKPPQLLPTLSISISIPRLQGLYNQR